MINKDNLKDLLKILNFKEESNEKSCIFSKYFPNTEAYLQVDFNQEKLIYPTDKGFIVNGEFTNNFSSNENFVVFECVHRLFEKGYKPEHIELEPKWKLGHGASGGRADILVKDHSNKSLLIIECKTEGAEFKKEWNNTLQRGGQLFSYVKQAGTTQYVCLYASDCIDGKVIPYHYLVSLKDNDKLLQELKDKKPLSFAEAKALEVEDLYKAWKETYNLDYSTKGIFEDDILPYQMGKTKYTTSDLLAVGSKDIQSKYHEFATIMRQHNVSGRENAFDKLVNLFLCKIVDETENPTDLKFNWKGIAYDNYFDLIDRLQTLYQVGMDKFLGEKVTNVSRNEIVGAFRYVKNDPDATQDTILKFFRELKYFKNNDFSFIDVHNEKLFYQNAVVLLEIVKMLQDIRLQSTTGNQFLGDMFEGFLDNGVKQSEGQFFTPMPIVKFILNSLPLEKMIQTSELPPKAIDYACGAGHFLNELALQIKPFVIKHKKTDVKEYYKEIVGIEKEYRLSKVAKVSAFMYGQDEVKIIYADALGKNAILQDSDYSILVANPPYAVKGFLQTLSEAERKSYTLFNLLDEKSLANNNSIETFFIERAKHLLKPGAVAGIVLPSSILSNDATVYTITREIILKYFQIVAITEFGSHTFGKTGTNTVTLFLRRKEENPAPADHWKNRVNAWFTNNEADAVYKDSMYLNNYCKHIEIDVSMYTTLLISQPNEALLNTDRFVDYKKAFDNLTEIKNLLKQKSFKDKSKADQDTDLYKRFVNYLQGIEKDKLYYFVLAAENPKVLIVKCPTDNKDQKTFLGYEWSSAKGNEGIKYINQSNASADINDTETQEFIQKTQGIHNINTPLYNPNNRYDNQKINQYIQQNFLGNQLPITENLSPYLAYYNLTDMLDFGRVGFNKQILTTPKKLSAITSKWEIERIENLCEIGRGRVISQKEIESKKGIYPVYSSQTSNEGILGYLNSFDFDGEYVTWTTDGIYAGTCFYRNGKFNCTNVCGTLKITKENVLAKYLPLALNLVTDNYVVKSANPKLMNNVMATIKIPLPPLNVQQQLVDECNLVDEEVEKAKLEVEKGKTVVWDFIDKNIIKANYPEIKIGNLATTSSGGTPLSSIGEYYYGGNIPWINSGEVSQGEIYTATKFITKLGLENSSAKLMPVDTVLLAMYGATAGKVGVLKIEATTNQAVCGILPNDKYIPKFLYFQLRNIYEYLLSLRTGIARDNLSQNKIQDIKIKLPPIAEQLKLVTEIEKLEQTIQAQQQTIDNAAARKQALIKKYV